MVRYGTGSHDVRLDVEVRRAGTRIGCASIRREITDHHMLLQRGWMGRTCILEVGIEGARDGRVSVLRRGVRTI